MQFMVSPDCKETPAATSEFKVKIDQNNISYFIFPSFQNNNKPCNSFDLCNASFCYNHTSSSLVVHLNIFSLQAHFDELIEFLHCFSNPPSILLLSETRIKTNPSINVNISGYSFVHSPSPTNAGGVGVYFSKNLKFTQNYTLNLKNTSCKDLWFDIKFPGTQNASYTFAVIYRHPGNDPHNCLEALDENMQTLNQKGNKSFIFGDLNFNTNLANPPPVILDYLHTLENNAFCNLITLPTRVTSDSETIIDNILTNVTDTAITPGVLHYKISDHYPIYCLISIPISKNCQKRDSYSYRNLKLFDGFKFCEDLEISLTPLVSELLNLPLTNQSLDLSFNKNVSEIIDKHAHPNKLLSANKNASKKILGVQKDY